MHSRLSFFLLALVLPLAVCFPAQPSSNVLHPRHIHQTFLQLKARRIRHAAVKLASSLVTSRAQLAVSSRIGLAFEPCTAADECQGGRSCAQLSGSTSGAVELADCDSGLCFCADMEGCSSTADCLEGETCASGGTCVSNSFVPNAASIDEADPSLGLNLDPCESIADCQNPRNCVQFVQGVFGQCAGPNCFCVRLDPSCTSTSECSQGEACTQREGSSNAICISETAILNGDPMEEEIEEIPAIAPVLPTLPDTATPPPVAATPPPSGTDEMTDQGTDESTPDTPDEADAPTPLPVPMPLPEVVAPATPAPVPEADGAAPTVVATPAAAPTGVVEATPPPAEPEQADREPGIVLPGAEGATVSPDTEDGEEVAVGPSDTDVEDVEDGEVLPSPGEEIVSEPGVSPTPEVEGDGEDEEGAEATPEDVICIGEHHLVHMSHDELLYSSNRVARVLCDQNKSCATPGHIVMYNDKAMMMSSYCAETTCAAQIMKVNSPRYRRAARVDSHTAGLSFTAFAARYETAAEEHLLRTFVRMGL